MINVFAVFTGKLLQTLQNSSFHKTCYLEAKTNVFHNFNFFKNWFGTILPFLKIGHDKNWFCTILPFLKIGHDKRFCCFYWKTAANTAK